MLQKQETPQESLIKLRDEIFKMLYLERITRWLDGVFKKILKFLHI